MANSCKFQKTQYQVSYDNGTTWEDVVPTQFAKGELIEYDSPDCNGIDTNYRWRTLEGQYLCDGNKKYTKQIQEESYDNGETWYVSYPTIYRGGEYVGEDDEFCCDKFIGHYIYVEPTPTCQSGYYWNGVRCVRNSSGGVPSGMGPKYYYDPLKVIKCDGNGSLTTADTSYYTVNYRLISAEIGDSVTSIGDSAFAYSSLETITIPSGVTSIGNYAFAYSSSITSVTVNPTTPPSLGTSAFTGAYPIYVPCESLLDYWTDWNEYIWRITSNPSCPMPTPTGATKLILTYTTTAQRWIYCNSSSELTASEVCSDHNPITSPECNAIYSAEIGNCVTSIENNAFINCVNLTTVNIPSGVTSIGDWAFQNCSGLVTCTIEENSQLTSIGSSAFTSCGSLTSATIPSGVTIVEDGAFAYCSSLTSIDIPNSITYIDGAAFAHCSALTSITIGNGVTEIYHGAFRDCPNLESVTINATTPPNLGSNVFYNTNNCPIFVPNESINLYKSANYWSNYADRIQGIT